MSLNVSWSEIQAFNACFKNLVAANIVASILLDHHCTAILRITKDGAIHYQADLNQPISILPGNTSYEIRFAVTDQPTERCDPNPIARVIGQQSTWDLPCWPSMILTLGQTMIPETAHLVDKSGRPGWPCTFARCITTPGQRVDIHAEHFDAAVDLRGMYSTPPDEDPDKELVVFLMVSHGRTNGLIVIQRV